ncbi:MAG: hypothetical protein GY865_18125, partial [candidate division Zixibacteria bacterium]|nr:hypothetical protein [candidate division Zixibacteria bacterium]
MDNIYWYDGKTVRPIGDSIKTTDYSGGMSWQDFIANNIGDYNASVFVQYYERKNIVLFIASRTITGTHAFTYHLTRQKWDYPKLLSTATATGIILTLDGVLFLARNSVTDSVYEAFANTDYYDLEWVSSELPKLEMAQLKKFYNLVAEGTNLTVTYSINGGSTWRALTSGTEVKDVSGDWEHKQTIMIKLVATSSLAFAECENLELIFRRMRGKR